ncbi:hypothetical protein I3842_02G162400 [Carya illinoinensis]|uniref:Reverse transcriptase n=1 Tax=Carya illinoinensis TaxID=32201 RepID=A0A922K6C8_CARIL|nr:hypothetical protein I3842_02G162400 [Carya illinoinensis]
MTEEIQIFDRITEERALTPEELLRKTELVSELERILSLEEISWRQKSRALWLKEGDRSTKFFHRVANSYRRNNTIDMLKINGRDCTEAPVIREHVVSFFDNLFSEREGWRPTVDGLDFDSIEPQVASWLERAFEEDEVHDVIRKMEKDKVPGPDRFSMGFFQTCWEVVKEDIMNVFQEFFHAGKFTKSLNATFIALIPKKSGASEVKDFRPISLINGIYKILLGKIISG